MASAGGEAAGSAAAGYACACHALIEPFACGAAGFGELRAGAGSAGPAAAALAAAGRGAEQQCGSSGRKASSGMC
eukprot:360262-Chlamydomonas_euryale.AAC.6